MKRLIVYLILVLTALTYCVAESQFAKCTSDEHCIPFEDCAPLKALPEKGRLTAEEKTYLRSRQCNSIDHVAYVCCNKPSNDSDSIHQKFTLPEPPLCGTVFVNKIHRGAQIELNEIPSMVQIQYLKPGNITESHCVGSLISERFVLTAAHCGRRIPKTWKIVQVRLGDWDVTTNPDCIDYVNERLCNDPFVEVQVAQVIVHESYNPDALNHPNDIALLKLERNVQFTEFIKPICLPVDTSLRSFDFTGHALEEVVYRRTESARSGSIPFEVVLNSIPQNSCRNYYSTHGITILDSQICAGRDESTDARCSIHGGGPLIKNGFRSTSHVYRMLVGIASFGPKHCGTINIPGVYTRVSEYVDWIIANMN